MKKRKLGRTGLEVSPIAVGGAAFGYVNKASNWDPRSDEGRRTVIEVLNHGLDCGMNYIGSRRRSGFEWGPPLLHYRGWQDPRLRVFTR